MRGLNAPSSEILLLLKHNNCLAGMEKTDCFCYRYLDSVFMKKNSIRIKFLLIIHATIAKYYIFLTFYNNDLPKIIYVDTY